MLAGGRNRMGQGVWELIQLMIFVDWVFDGGMCFPQARTHLECYWGNRSSGVDVRGLLLDPFLWAVRCRVRLGKVPTESAEATCCGSSHRILWSAATKSHNSMYEMQGADIGKYRQTTGVVGCYFASV
ncbi:hypothetical protein CC86DRAFT_190362 [Ophiobolus disseminans]|uniref:Uncharacterized protein n=1 Tax=Ophiobolus disseminans TaxID=1469910 RepID=A0A6A7A8J5_9PLEO|nr:hypothetical protein CC86DRAFT_190362 [Ophiobolus disseminans]